MAVLPRNGLSRAERTGPCARIAPAASFFSSPGPDREKEKKRIDTAGTAELVRAYGLRRFSRDNRENRDSRFSCRMSQGAVFELNYIRVMVGLQEPSDVGRMTPAQRAFLRRLLSDALEGGNLGDEGKEVVRGFVREVGLLSADADKTK